jgi:hypothetical protein
LIRILLSLCDWMTQSQILAWHQFTDSRLRSDVR